MIRRFGANTILQGYACTCVGWRQRADATTLSVRHEWGQPFRWKGGSENREALSDHAALLVDVGKSATFAAETEPRL
jgi:hypothetical protein